MNLSPSAKELFDYLPEDGSKVGGITVKRDTDLNTTTLKEAKAELKEAGLVILGKGRGGSIARVEGKRPEPKQTVSAEERMAMAREAKQENSRAKKEHDEWMQRVLDYVHEEGYPEVEAKDIALSEGRPIIAIWTEKCARMHTIPQLEYDKLMAL